MPANVQPPVPGYEDHGVFLDFTLSNRPVCSMVAPLSALGFGDALWNFEFWNPVRDASGMYHWGQKLGLPDLTTRARNIINLALLAPAFLSCTFFEKNRLQAVIAAGELVVLTRTSPTTYYETPEGPAGFEYDLVKGFADYLGVNPRFIVVPKFSDIIPRFLEGDGDMAAAGITVTGRAPGWWTPTHGPAR